MKTRSLNRDDYEAISKIMRDGELECTPEYIAANLPAGVTLEDNGRVIGFCGLIPCKIWIGQTVKEACQLGMLGMEPGHGTALMCLLDGVRSAVNGRFVYANTANKNGAKVWTRFYGMKAGPKENAIIRYKPIVPFLGFACADEVKDDARWHRFVSDLRANNDGIMTERSVAGWQRLKATCVTICRGEEILGAAFLRCRYFSRLKLPRYDIVDICAVKNDAEILERLLKKCVRMVARKGGLILEYVGSPTGRNEVFNKVLTRQRPAVSNTFVYDGDEDISKGWFFGPYDGDRCVS